MLAASETIHGSTQEGVQGVGVMSSTRQNQAIHTRSKYIVLLGDEGYELEARLRTM